MRALALPLALAILAGCAAPLDVPTGPRVMAALGDSITRALNLDPALPGEHPEHSWATGLDPDDGVLSHAERLFLLPENAHNNARSGARVSDLARQVGLAIAQKAEYVTILIGMNDVCGRRGQDATGVDEFRAGLRGALATLRAGLPNDATILVISLPDASRLAETLANDSFAQAMWSFGGACGGLLPERADELADRIDAFNAVLAEEASRAGAGYDDGAVHATALARGDVSRLDAFHPSLSGQARLADVSWASAFI